MTAPPTRRRPAPRDLPQWDGDRRELRWRGRLVKRFRQPAPNQETVLAAFDRAGWPPAIDDPLPPSPDVDARERLHDTIKNLNRPHGGRVLRFAGDGSGRRVLWESHGRH